jgi:hypothetical protein
VATGWLKGWRNSRGLANYDHLSSEQAEPGRPWSRTNVMSMFYTRLENKQTKTQTNPITQPSSLKEGGETWSCFNTLPISQEASDVSLNIKQNSRFHLIRLHPIGFHRSNPI